MTTLANYKNSKFSGAAFNAKLNVSTGRLQEKELTTDKIQKKYTHEYSFVPTDHSRFRVEIPVTVKGSYSINAKKVLGGGRKAGVRVTLNANTRTISNTSNGATASIIALHHKVTKSSVEAPLNTTFKLFLEFGAAADIPVRIKAWPRFKVWARWKHSRASLNFAKPNGFVKFGKAKVTFLKKESVPKEIPEPTGKGNLAKDKRPKPRTTVGTRSAIAKGFKPKTSHRGKARSGHIVIKFSDGYSLEIKDSIKEKMKMGRRVDGKAVQIALGHNGHYSHILNTNLIKIVKKK